MSKDTTTLSIQYTEDENDNKIIDENAMHEELDNIIYNLKNKL